MDDDTPLSGADSAQIARFGEVARALREQISRRLLGQHSVVDQVLVTFFSGGHCLLMGVPGLGKTMLVRALAETLSLKYSRIQFTPDLMPSDITGNEILVEDAESGTRVMRFQPGPVFANLLLADEINRTPPKTQAALMEAMEEEQVTAGGERHPLEAPFFVMATQNPIEQEGTYSLPAAQLDRFMMRIEVPYPGPEVEARIGRLVAAPEPSTISTLLEKAEVLELHSMVRRITVPDPIAKHALDLVRATRPDSAGAPDFVPRLISWGAGPRAAQWLLQGGRAAALLDGRTTVKEEDVRALVHPVLRHRIIPNFRAEAESVTTDDILDRLLEAIPGTTGFGIKVVAKPKTAWQRLVGAVTGSP